MTVQATAIGTPEARNAFRVLLLGAVLTGVLSAYLGALWLVGIRIKDFRRAPTTSRSTHGKGAVDTPIAPSTPTKSE